DNDEPGQQHAESVARSCVAAGLVAKIVPLPNLPPKGDVCDFLDAGGTVEQLRALVDAAPGWPPDITQNAEEPHRLTDVGNGHLFARQHRDYARYCYPLKSWFICNERGLWQRDLGDKVMQLAKTTVISMYDQARNEANEERRTKLAAHAV